MKKYITVLSLLGLCSFANAGAIIVAPTVLSATVASQAGGTAPIYNARPEALRYNGGEISATLQLGIDVLDALYDTSNLTNAEKIKYIGHGEF